MASTDARPVPIKNTAFRLTFPIYKNDGTLITGAAGLDSEVSKDAGTAADCTNEATEIATSTGMYYLDLTSTEMNADCVAVVVKTSSTGACIPTFVLYPQESGDIKVDVQSWLGTAAATPTVAGVPEVDITHIAGAVVSATTAQLGVNVVQISADATAADNLEAAYDGAGYAGGTIPQQVVLTTSGKEAVADQVWDENITGHITANSAGAVLQPSHSGACQAGGNTTTVVLASSASSADGYYNGDLIFGWVTADRTNFFADYISDYVGATRTATVTGIAVSPDATYTYVIVPGGSIPGASAPTASEVADAVLDEAISGHTTEGTVGAVLGTFHLHAGTAQAGASASITLDATGSSTTENFYKYGVVVIRAGTGAGQSRQISAYSAARVATVSPAWTTAPDNTSEYVVIPLGIDASTPANVATAVWAATRAGNATAGSFGEYVNADAVRISGDATAADNLEAGYDGAGYAGGTIKQTVLLADGTHGGSASVLTLRRAVIANTTNGETALDVSASGTGNAHAVRIAATGAGKGMAISGVSNGISIDSSGADGVAIQGGTDSDGLQIAGAGTGVDIRADITGDITGSLSGDVGGGVGGNVTGSVGSLAAQAKADVNAEVLDVLNTDTFAEPGQEAPGATVSLVKKIGYLYKGWRNKVTQTATEYALYNDDGTTVGQKATVSDDATTATRGEVGTGA